MLKATKATIAAITIAGVTLLSASAQAQAAQATTAEVAASGQTVQVQYATGPLSSAIGSNFAVQRTQTYTAPRISYPGHYVNPNNYTRLVRQIRALKLHQRKLMVLRNRLYSGYVAWRKCTNQWTRAGVSHRIARKIFYFRSIGRYDLAAKWRNRAHQVASHTRSCKRILSKRIRQTNTLIWIKQNRLNQIRRQIQG